MKNKGLIHWFVLMSLLIFLAGCHLSGDSEKKEENQKEKDVFTYAIGGNPTSLNPINVGDRWGLTVVNMIYSPLVRINNDGTQKMELAESLEPSDDGKSLLVTLKEGIEWSDGEPFTSEDVIFTYEQKSKKENGNADALWIDDEPITVEKIDQKTIRFHFPSISAAAINNIATETYILPKHIFEEEDDFSVNELKADAVGTGPYKLINYERGEYLQFEANSSYYGGNPAIKNITLRIIENSDTAKLALQKGEIDATFVLPSDISELKKAGLVTYEYSENRVGYMGINNNSKKLQEIKTRQAILYGLDRDELNQAAYLSKTYYENAYTIFPPANLYATDAIETYQLNIEKAKKLLKESGNENVQLNLAFSSDDPVQKIQATLIQQQLQKIGVEVELVGGDGSAIFTELKKPNSEKYDLFMGGYIMGNEPDLYAALYASDGASNYFHYSSEQTDQLFKQGLLELDEKKRQEIYFKLQQQIAQDATVYPIVDNRKILAVNASIRHVEDAKLVAIYTFEDLSKLTIE